MQGFQFGSRGVADIGFTAWASGFRVRLRRVTAAATGCVHGTENIVTTKNRYVAPV